MNTELALIPPRGGVGIAAGLAGMVFAWAALSAAATAAFEVAHVRSGILAEGHIHRSLGALPQEQVGTSVVWPKAIFTVLRRPR